MDTPKWHSFSHNTAHGTATQAFGNFYGNVYLGDHGPSKRPGNLLGARDPRIDLERIRFGQELIKDCLNWIVPPIQRWLNDPDCPVLWIRGDAGKGKTTLIIALVDQLISSKKHAEVNSQHPGLDLSIPWEDYLLSFLFFRKSDHKLNNVTDALRSLLYLLSNQSKAAKQLIKERCDDQSDSVALHLTLQAALADVEQPTLFLIDAVDECQPEDWDVLLRSISNHPANIKSKSKWIVTSRKQPNLNIKCDGCIDLEDDRSQIRAAVEIFAHRKSQQLIDNMNYENDVADRVRKAICSKAGSTFLWVALACNRLANIRKSWEVEDELDRLPADLTQMYDWMMNDVLLEKEFVRDILRSVTVAFRPLRLFELESIAYLPHNNPKESTLRSMVASCASFLTIHHGNVELIHPTARDYLLSTEGRNRLGLNLASVHRAMALHMMASLRTRLAHNDILGCGDPGTCRANIKSEVIEEKLANLKYAIRYWLNHCANADLVNTEKLCELSITSDSGRIEFLCFLRDYFLRWSGSLLWLGWLPEGLVAIRQLQISIRVSVTHRNV